MNNNSIDKLKLEEVLLDTLPIPVYYKDNEGNIVHCNNCFAKLIQRKKSEIIGQIAYSFFNKETSDRHKIIDKEITKNLGSNVDEFVYTAPDGTIKYLSIKKAVYLNADDKVGGIVCVIDDITTHVKEKELLIQQNKLAEIGEMIASIVHQWKEPLVELSALVQKIEYYYSIDEIDRKMMSDSVKLSMKHIKYMSDTIDDFRNFLKPSIEKDNFDIKIVFQEIFEILSRELFYYNIPISVRYLPITEVIYIDGYKNELKQVFLNIINNAKNKIVNKANKEKFEGHIEIIVEKKNTYVNIKILDNAGAIDEKIVDKIFNPFFTTKPDGMGYGLYISKTIIEDKMSGKISVENKGDNVSFLIKLPIKE